MFIQKYNPKDYTNAIDNIFSINTIQNIGTTRTVHNIEPLIVFEKTELVNTKYISDIIPIDDSLRRYRDEDNIPQYNEYINMINFKNYNNNLFRIKNDNIVSFQNASKFKIDYKIDYILNPGDNNQFITKDTIFDFEGYTSPGQAVKVQYAATGEVITEVFTDKYFGNYKLNFELEEGLHELAFISYGANKPNKYFYINIKVDLNVQNTFTDFLEVLDTNMITKSELNTTKLVGTIEEYSKIIKIELSDNKRIVEIPTSNLILNRTNWTYEILLEGLELLDDGQITAHVTVQDLIGNKKIITNNIELFKFAFSPIVMFI